MSAWRETAWGFDKLCPNGFHRFFCNFRSA